MEKKLKIAAGNRCYYLRSNTFDIFRISNIAKHVSRLIEIKSRIATGNRIFCSFKRVFEPTAISNGVKIKTILNNCRTNDNL